VPLLAPGRSLSRLTYSDAMRRRYLVLPIAIAALAPAPAAAQVLPPTDTAPAPAPSPSPEPAPAPKPEPGRATLALRGGLATKHVRWYMRGQTVKVVGTVRPYVPDQVVTLSAIRGKRAADRWRVPVERGRRGNGRFVVRFTPGRRGQLRLVARHRRTEGQAAFRARDKRVGVVSWQAGHGASGLKVLVLQRGLLSLGFATPISGRFDAATARGVLTFRKTNGMGRSGYASKAVYRNVMRRRGAFPVRYPRAGRHVEFDWSRQVIVLAKGARPYRVFHTSSGKASTPTVFGTFRFYTKQPGTNSHGMVHSSYFIGGYAIHGYPSVPNYPASHGCLRIPIPNARFVYDWIPLGMTIFSYR
jgi:hypothetical protein